MDTTEEIEKMLNGRWVTQDKNSAFFFASPEEDDTRGFMTVQQPSLPISSFDFKVNRQDNKTLIIYRSREIINERTMEISSISSDRLALVTDGKAIILLKG